MTDSHDPGQPVQPPHRRRKRYSGTHPKRFEQRYKELNPEAHPEIVEHVRAQGRTPAGSHVPVLLKEVLDCLKPQPGEVVADCTLGYGGHAAELMKRVGPTGRLIGFDLDHAEMERTRARLAALGLPFRLYRSNFAGIAKAIRDEGIEGYNIILADLGVSSMQLDNPVRGFSYKHDGPLDMRMDDRTGRSAAELLGSMSAEDLSAALRDLGDEPDHERIAEAVLAQRGKTPIKRTRQLVQLVLSAKGLTDRIVRETARKNAGALHPAARTFQALRILVNDELGSLRELLRVAAWCLRPGGRIAIISFHSGEGKMVAESFLAGLQAGHYSAISEEPLRPTAEERFANPRSASAKLRWAIKA